MKNKINTKGLTKEQIETVNAFVYAVREGNVDRIDACKRGEWAKTSRALFNPAIHYRITKPTADDYLKGHKASGLKVGDRVKVLHDAELGESGWLTKGENTFLEERAKMIGREFTIGKDEGKRGFAITPFLFPHFVLEKVEPEYRPWTAEEAIGQKIRGKSADRQDTVSLIVSASSSRGFWLVGNDYPTSWEDLNSLCTQLDGSPCGVLITEE